MPAESAPKASNPREKDGEVYFIEANDSPVVTSRGNFE